MDVWLAGLFALLGSLVGSGSSVLGQWWLARENRAEARADRDALEAGALKKREAGRSLRRNLSIRRAIEDFIEWVEVCVARENLHDSMEPMGPIIPLKKAVTRISDQTLCEMIDEMGMTADQLREVASRVPPGPAGTLESNHWVRETGERLQAFRHCANRVFIRMDEIGLQDLDELES